jgi:hypothetical protein
MVRERDHGRQVPSLPVSLPTHKQTQRVVKPRTQQVGRKVERGTVLGRGYRTRLYIMLEKQPWTVTPACRTRRKHLYYDQNRFCEPGGRDCSLANRRPSSVAHGNISGTRDLITGGGRRLLTLSPHLDLRASYWENHHPMAHIKYRSKCPPGVSGNKAYREAG